MSSDGEVPADRCGFLLEPEDVDVDWVAENYEAETDKWYRRSDAVCCWREVWEGGDGERCIWNADTDDKPADALLDARADRPERLDAAYVPAVELGDAIDFEECGLQAATFDGTGLRGTSFDKIDGRVAQFPDTDLLHAQFPDANLCATNFTDADLESVDLTDTNLFDAALQGTFLYGATFEDASINSDTTFGAHYVPAPSRC